MHTTQKLGQLVAAALCKAMLLWRRLTTVCDFCSASDAGKAGGGGEDGDSGETSCPHGSAKQASAGSTGQDGSR